MSTFSFLIELAKQKFDETTGGATSWIMAMPIGVYQHPRYGKINLTVDRIQRFADNVNRGIRGQELDIDYDHKEYSGEAAGWVKQAEARPDGLWLLVDWTTKAYEAIKSKAYRYFSPEFNDMWSDPRTGEKFKDVLFGGGITNRPFLKGIQPLNLNEFYSTQQIALKENGSMDPDQIRELAAKLGLGEDATPEMLFGALMMKLGGDKPADPKPEDKPEPPADAPKPPAQNDENNGAPVPQYSDIANHPYVKKLTETLELQSRTLSEMATNAKLKKLNETAEEAGRLITPVAETSIKKLLSESPSDEYTDTLIKALTEIFVNVGPISGEVGGQHKRLNSSDEDATKKFSDQIDKLMKANTGMSYAEAAVMAAANDTEAFEAHRVNSYLVEGE